MSDDKHEPRTKIAFNSDTVSLVQRAVCSVYTMELSEL